MQPKPNPLEDQFGRKPLSVHTHTARHGSYGGDPHGIHQPPLPQSFSFPQKLEHDESSGQLNGVRPAASFVNDDSRQGPDFGDFGDFLGQPLSNTDGSTNIDTEFGEFPDGISSGQEEVNIFGEFNTNAGPGQPFGNVGGSTKFIPFGESWHT